MSHLPRSAQLSENGKLKAKGAMVASKLAAVGAVHLVRAAHLAARRREHAAARVLELIARVEEGLLADHAGPAHLFDRGRRRR